MMSSRLYCCSKSFKIFLDQLVSNKDNQKKNCTKILDSSSVGLSGGSEVLTCACSSRQDRANTEMSRLNDLMTHLHNIPLFH